MQQAWNKCKYKHDGKKPLEKHKWDDTTSIMHTGMKASTICPSGAVSYPTRTARKLAYKLMIKPFKIIFAECPKAFRI
jgi:hypothetical protein